jgi:hypothetical protein
MELITRQACGFRPIPQSIGVGDGIRTRDFRNHNPFWRSLGGFPTPTSGIQRIIQRIDDDRPPRGEMLHLESSSYGTPASVRPGWAGLLAWKGCRDTWYRGVSLAWLHAAIKKFVRDCQMAIT